MTFTPIRCPHDNKFWFEATTDSQGTARIKCRGKCGELWHITWRDGQLIILLAEPQPAS